MARFPVAPRTTRPSIVKDTFFDGVKLWLKESSLVDDELQPALQNLKVIDCATRTLVYAPADCVYLALSYVWGTNQDCSSLDGNLPQSIEDSLRTVLLLGHRYLWVDRYVCIAFWFDMEADCDSASIRRSRTSIIRYSKWAQYTLEHT